MKTLVTGANGFVGRTLCTCLESNGHWVVRAVRRLSHLSDVLVGDIGPDTDWRAALAACDTVVHLAARVHVLREEASDQLAEFRAVNTEGTMNLARQAVQAGVRRFVLLSSIKVNGEQTSPPFPQVRVRLRGEREYFSENDLPAPQDPYAVSKWEAEQGLLQLAAEVGMEVVIIRPPLVYGPGVKANFLAMMRWLRRGIPLPLGAIHNKRSLVALDNLVDLIVTCIGHPLAANQIFLVGDGEDLSTTELLSRMGKYLGKPARLLPIPQKIIETGLKGVGRSDLAQRLCGSLQVDISKARQLLGWNPPLSVDEGLRRTAQGFLHETSV
jgi:nucleoside-diphosphate-sugar epimerase